ncbi:MAG: OsmC family peroxiredoxin, partial [Betaproteobacteria bacterium]|nr:OsmC family peroxiredoxin [Betaproteobacteria bacterium]
MVTVVPKTVVTMRLNGSSASHSRTDVSARDVRTTIDEPAERGGTNQGLTPTETL